MACEQDGGVVWKRSDNPLVQGSAEDIWDDTALINAYDKAVAQLKQIENPESSDDKPSVENGKRKKKRKSKKSNKKSWKVGSQCLAVFGEDGLYYEATILSINLEARSAHVQYDFYENEEEVDIDQLLPLDNKVDMQPVFNGTTYSSEQQGSETDGISQNTEKNNIEFVNDWRISDICFAPDEKRVYQQAVINSFVSTTQCQVTFIKTRKKKEVKVSELRSKMTSSNKTGAHGSSHTSESNLPNVWWPLGPESVSQFPHLFTSMPPPHSFASMPPPLPQFNNGSPSGLGDWSNMFPNRYSSPTKFPPFPPPPVVPDDVIAGNEEALANMLMSWYMSGYHTGYYQGIQKNRNGRPIKKRNEKSASQDSNVSL